MVTLEREFLDSLADDLNMPGALAALFKFVRQVNPILDTGAFSEPQREQVIDALKRINEILGVFDFELGSLSREETAMMRRRESARREKNWAEADQLLERGIKVVDTAWGTRWERVQRREG